MTSSGVFVIITGIEKLLISYLPNKYKYMYRGRHSFHNDVDISEGLGNLEVSDTPNLIRGKFLEEDEFWIPNDEEFGWVELRSFPFPQYFKDVKRENERPKYLYNKKLKIIKEKTCIIKIDTVL